MGKCKIKIPIAEVDFLKDQRSNRKMYIGSVDLVTTKSIFQKDERKRKYESFLEKTVNNPSTYSAPNADCLSDSSSIVSSEDDLHELCISQPIKKKKKQTQQMIQRLQNLAAACDRTGVSDRSAAIVVNAAMLDLNVISTDNSSKVIDRSKLRRERQKVRKDLQRKGNGKQLSALYFDGRKDKTLVITKTENTSHRKTVTEEHILLISKPDSEYIGHLCINSGKAISIEKCIIEFLEKGYDYQNTLMAIGCDGTAVNTGRKNGVIALLEKRLNRPLQWCVCLLHANELPLRHLFASLDGTTTGPNSFCGSIGKQLEGCLNHKVVPFDSISIELPELNVDTLSKDQKYLYEICSAISRGKISSSLANRDPGKLAHSRWLTLANRCLRLYVGTVKPTDNLRDLVSFIMKVYAPTWFDIKTKPSCKYGPIHVFNMVKRSLYLREGLKSIIVKTIQRNSFFAHPENMLLAMLQDDESHIRQLAFGKIQEARKNTKGKTVREFQLQQLDISANYYYDLINWSNEHLTEPPLTMKYSDEEIRNMISGDNFMNFQNFPCHTQAVERCVKLVK